MERAELIALARATGCVEEHGRHFFLCDPKWGTSERETVGRLLTGDSAGSGEGWLCIPTGGSSGTIKFARHDERTLTAAASGFCAHFGLERVNAVDVLPPFHVSGLMSRVRCAETGGQHVPWPWRRLETGVVPTLAENCDWVISLVPTQLQRLLSSMETTAWLRRFAVIFLGGGPSWPELAEAAARAGLRLSLSYGMTETAAMIAALRPDEFLAGARSAGAVLPHGRVTIDSDGVIAVGGASLFRGYYPHWRSTPEFETADLGRIDESGHLHVLGRRDTMIITGGEKVSPMEVEAALRGTGLLTDVGVIGMPDPEWGEVVVACYPAADATLDLTAVRERIEGVLAAYKRPKRYVAVGDWPRNSQGKLNRLRLAELVRDV